MATAFVDQITGQGETVAYKAPCRVATTANITLAGLQTVDGVALVANDRVMVKNQTDQKANGVYIASTAGWTRARDWDGNRDVTKGTRLTVTDGTANGGREYILTSANPITIGSSNITFAESLSSNAGASAAAAAASATAAAGSATAASGFASAASTSATNAGNSATAAAGSATTATTQATNAGNSATAASGSASSASTSATNAGNSATAAAGSATAASGSATTASGSATAAGTSATNAATSETNAAASAAAAANSVAALGYTYSATTTDADPGNGVLRLNNASPASATAAYIDNLDAGGSTVTSILDTFDDSTNTIKGQVTLRSKASASISYVFNVTGSVVDGSGYRKLTLAYVSGSGSLPTTSNGVWLLFSRAGDKGANGTGTGDFSGPAASVADNIVTFNDTTGKTGKDSGVAVSSLAPKASPAFTGSPTAPTQTGGDNSTKLATTAYVDAADASKAPLASPALTGNPTAPTQSAGNNSTRLATTAYVDTAAALKAPLASPAFTGTPTAPTAVGGTNTTQIATTAFVAAAVSALKLQAFYQSTQQTITSAGALTLAHGLGVQPVLVMIAIVCQTAENGYSVGDELLMNIGITPNSGARGISIVPDGTNLNIRFASGAAVFDVLNKGTGATGSITPANWKLIVRAWA